MFHVLDFFSSIFACPLSNFVLLLEVRKDTNIIQFVQCLSNPLYLNYLATQKLLDNPEFVAYLDYLQYFGEPKYIKYLS